jgi:hypothetical protein
MAGNNTQLAMEKESFCREQVASKIGFKKVATDLKNSAIHEPLNVLASRHFQVIYLDEVPKKQVLLVAHLLEDTHDKFYATMRKAGFRLDPVQGSLNCVTFSSRSQFDRYARKTEFRRLSWLDGYYSPRTNRVLLLLSSLTDWEKENRKDEGNVIPAYGVSYPSPHPEGSLARIAHEAAHQLAFNSGLQKRGVMYPFWVAEGLAASFETGSETGPAQLHPVRSRHLLQAYNEGNVRPLEEFLLTVVPRCRSRKELNDLYAQAWGVFHYLFTHHRAELRTYMELLAEDGVGRRTRYHRLKLLQKALPPVNILEAGWQGFLRDLQEKCPQ